MGGAGRLLEQLIANGVTIAFSFVVTVAILKLLDLTMGIRVDAEVEQSGLDLAEHGETAYGSGDALMGTSDGGPMPEGVRGPPTGDPGRSSEDRSATLRAEDSPSRDEGVGMGRQGDPRGSYHSQAKRALDELILTLSRQGTRRLPAEDELSEQLRFSRPTVRSALLSLQKEGKIQRLHGIGSFINRHALGMQANLAEDRPFLTLLEGMGYEAAVRTLSLGEVDIDEVALGRLELDGPQRACAIRRVFEASGRPAVYSTDLVPTAFLTGDVADVDAGKSTFEFVRTWTPRSVRYSVAGLRACSADAQIAAALEVSEGTPLVVLDHLHVDEEDTPIAITQAYVNDEILRFSMIRAYIDI